jgi:preprotein translocase subunit SecB
MKEASFRLEGYRFEKVNMDLSANPGQIGINIVPSGVYNPSNGQYDLSFVFQALRQTDNQAFITILCKARFVFREPVLLEEIPDYFYLNSIAILFPYVRAFVSIITLQANINPLMLPTMNLASLQETLKKNTNVCDDEKGKTIPNS